MIAKKEHNFSANYSFLVRQKTGSSLVVWSMYHEIITFRSASFLETLGKISSFAVTQISGSTCYHSIASESFHIYKCFDTMTVNPFSITLRRRRLNPTSTYRTDKGHEQCRSRKTSRIRKTNARNITTGMKEITQKIHYWYDIQNCDDQNHCPQ